MSVCCPAALGRVRKIVPRAVALAGVALQHTCQTGKSLWRKDIASYMSAAEPRKCTQSVLHLGFMHQIGACDDAAWSNEGAFHLMKKALIPEEIKAFYFSVLRLRLDEFDSQAVFPVLFQTQSCLSEHRKANLKRWRRGTLRGALSRSVQRRPERP